MMASRFTRWLTRPLRTLSLLALAGSVLVGGCASNAARPGRHTDASERAALQTQLAIGYLRRGKREVAIDRLQRALAIDPKYAPAHNALGLIEEQLGQLEAAESSYRRATELDPSFASAQNNFASLLCRRKKFAEASEAFAKAAGNPLYSVPELAHYNAGLCSLRRGDPVAADAQFREALATNPKHAPSLLAMSDLSLQAKKYLSARAYLERYLEVGARTPRTLWLGVRIERILGDKNAVSSYSMLLKSKYPEAPETQLLLKSEARQ